jgi:hypothetical protein
LDYFLLVLVERSWTMRISHACLILYGGRDWTPAPLVAYLLFFRFKLYAK